MTTDFRNVDYSKQEYRGYVIRFDALANKMRIMKNGEFIASVPSDKSWAHARNMIDQLILVDTL